MPDVANSFYCRWCSKAFPSRLSLQRHIARSRSCAAKRWNHLASLSQRALQNQGLILQIPAAARAPRAPRQPQNPRRSSGNPPSAATDTQGVGPPVGPSGASIDRDGEPAAEQAEAHDSDAEGGMEMEWEFDEPQRPEAQGQDLEDEGNLGA